MNYEDKQLESLLHQEAQGITPPPEMIRRALNGLQSKRTWSWRWLILAPAFAVVMLVALQRNTKDVTLIPVSQEQAIQEEQGLYNELISLDDDYFSDLDDENSHFLDILAEGSIVGAL